MRWGRKAGEPDQAILTHDVRYQVRRSQAVNEPSTKIFCRLCVRMRKNNVDIIAFRLPATVSVKFNLRKEEEEKYTYPPVMVLTQPGSTALR